MSAGRLLAVLVCVAAAAGVTFYISWTQRKPTALPAPATMPAPATRPLLPPPPPPIRSYVELVRAVYPAIAATQPLGVPLGLSEAAHIVLNEPLHLDFRGDVWITRLDATAIDEVLWQAPKEQIHLVPERIEFAFWSPDPSGAPRPGVVVRRADRWEWIDYAGVRTELPARAYRWRRAWVWGQRVVVPSDRGVSVLSFSPKVQEIHHELTAAAAEPIALIDRRGLLAWAPWESGKSGSVGAARFVDGNWKPLGAAEGWPEKILHLVPLLDGSVLQLIGVEGESIELALTALDAPVADERQIVELVQQLSDLDEDNRVAAYEQLTQYGPGLWPILERLMDDQPPEAQHRMRQLLGNRIRPTLGGMTLLAGPVKVAARHRDGGVLLYSDAGVSMSRDEGPLKMVSPAWISIRPGWPVQLLDPRLAGELQFGKCRISTFRDELIVYDDVRGPRRWLGNHLAPLLGKDERQYGHLIGVDRRGRWLWRKSEDADGPTLIVDPTLPDPTPRLPVWNIVSKGGAVGWDERDWPVMKRGGAWTLEESGWRALDEKKKILTEWKAPTTRGSESPLLIDAQGTRYYDGVETLHVVRASGEQTHWSLPPAAVGSGSPRLIRTPDGVLFLFNQPRRVLRIRPTPDAAEPFALEAVFTHRIPNADRPQRIWLDPAGRIVIAHDSNQLTILFPSGRVPREIALLMPAEQFNEPP